MVKKKNNAKNKVKKTKTANSGITPAVARQPVVHKVKTKIQKPKRNLSAMREGVCSITDPFCDKAKNSKWPDGQGAGTLATQLRYHQAIPAVGGASGGSLVFIGASLPYNYLIGTSYTAGNYTMSSTYNQTAAWSNISGYVSQYRITSWGIIVRNLASASNASGYLTISKVNTMPAVSAVVAGGSVDGTEVQTVSLAAGAEVCIIGRPLGTEARNFVAANTTTTTLDNWDTVRIESVGGYATGSMYDIEFYYNLEIIVGATSVMQNLTRPDIPMAPKTIQASSATLAQVGTIIEGGVEAVGKKLLDAAGKAAMDAMSEGLAWLML